MNQKKQLTIRMQCPNNEKEEEGGEKVQKCIRSAWIRFFEYILFFSVLAAGM